MPGKLTTLSTTLLFLLLGLAAVPARGQTGALAGHVVDNESGQAVGWTTVVIEGLDRARTSDAGGYFFFANVPPGVHVLRSLRVGYHEARFEVEVGRRGHDPRRSPDRPRDDRREGRRRRGRTGPPLPAAGAGGGLQQQQAAPEPEPHHRRDDRLRAGHRPSLHGAGAGAAGAARAGRRPAAGARGRGAHRRSVGHLLGPRRGHRAHDHRAHRGGARTPDPAPWLQRPGRGGQRGARATCPPSCPMA